MDENIRNKSVFSLSWPIFVSSLLAILLGYVDTAMLSRYNENAVGAIGNANTVMSFLTLAFTIISGATGILTSQYLGCGTKNKKEMNRVYSVSVLFNLCLSVLISVLLYAFHPLLLMALNVPRELQGDAAAYIKIVGGLIFAQSVFDTFGQIFRSNGKTKIGMALALAMNIINIIGDYSVLYGPLKGLNLGVSGVAAVTALSRIAMLIIAVLYFVFKIDGSIGIKYLRPFPGGILKKLLGLGIPSAGETISYNLSQITVAAIVNTLGIIAINARVFCNMLFGFTYLVPVSLALGTQIIVGHNVGAEEYDKAYRRVVRTAAGALGISISIAVINYLLSGYTLGFFSDSAQTIELGRKIMLIGIFLEFGRTTNIVIINSMKAAGDVKFPTTLGICSMWGFSVGGGFLLGVVCGFGLPGVWAAMAADEIFRAVVVAIRWKRGGWRGKRVVDDSRGQ